MAPVFNRTKGGDREKAPEYRRCSGDGSRSEGNDRLSGAPPYRNRVGTQKAGLTRRPFVLRHPPAQFSPGCASSVLSGEGASAYGGRWNYAGIPMVYAAHTRALAALESLAHFGGAERRMAPRNSAC
jgi:hypothetical protein